MERLDRPWDGAMDRDTQVTSGTGATGAFRALAHARNRMYDPAQGRFQSVDPNGLGLTAIETESLGDAASLAEQVNPNLSAHYGNGLNSHAAFGANPLGRQDAFGLSWDPFNDVDDFIAEHSASTAAFMEQLQTGFSTAGHIAWQLAQLNPAIGMAVSLYNIGSSLAKGEVPSVWDIIGLIPGGTAGKALAKAGAVLGKVRGIYAASKFGRGLSRAARALSKALPAAFHIGPTDTQVYFGYREGKVVYVGITNNIGRRQKEHGKRFVISPITPKMTRLKAMGVETLLILGARGAGYKLDNIRLSIARENPIFDAVIGAVSEIVDGIDKPW
jgi:hypothetical protein